MTIHFSPGDGRREFPASGVAAPRTAQEKAALDKIYRNVPDVPVPAAPRATLSDVDQRAAQAAAHAAVMNERRSRGWVWDNGVVRPKEQPAQRQQPATAPAPQRAVETPEPWEPDATAGHKCAHHIVAEKLGCRIEETSIEPRRRDDDGGLIYGHCRYVPPANQPLLHSLAISVAGGVAELMLYGKHVGGPDSGTVARKLDAAGITDKAAREKLVAEALELARGLLAPEKDRLREMAKHLRSVKTIKPEAAVQVRTFTTPMMIRSATMSAASNNDVVSLIWTSGASVRRNGIDGPFDEVLETGEKNVRLGRLNSGAPLLNSHDSSDLSRILGSVVKDSAKMINGQGVAKVKLSSRADVAGFVQDIRDGIITNVSVGYRYHSVVRDNTGGDVPVWRVTDWEPLEISAVAIPADGQSQFRGDATFDVEVRG